MKSRSHRLPVSEPHPDDWVNGSWTVDCVCGVTYDDGEEMVDCDECGVWVHTRCSRYVKSDDSFACDKCKSKNNGGGGDTNDSEETEVAEFLVELPTKTLRMDNPTLASAASRRPFRLWTDIPMEERVHVQGVPGGEPQLFLGSGTPSFFGPELWKSAGYVPKKFKFRYTDFPCLDSGKDAEKNELDKAGGEENANQADNGAGVLFSLLKENDNTLRSRLLDYVGVKTPVEGSGCHDVVSIRQKNLGGKDLGFSCPEDSMKKKTCSVRIVLPSGKRKKQELGMLKDQSVKKVVKTMEEDGDAKKRAANASKAVSTSSSDGKRLESSQDRGSKTVSIQCRQNVPCDQLEDGFGECSTNLASKEHGLEVTPRNDVSVGELSRRGNSEDHVSVPSMNFSKINNGVESLTEPNGSMRQLVKEEIPRETLQTGGVHGGCTGSAETGSHDKDHVAMDVKISTSDAKESRQGQISDMDEGNPRPNKKLKAEPDAADFRHHHIEPLPLNDVKFDTMKFTNQYSDSSVNVVSEKGKAMLGKVIESSALSPEASNTKVLDATSSPTVVSSRTDKFDESPGKTCPYKRQPTSEASTEPRKKTSGLKCSSEVADDLHKSNGTAKSHSTASNQRNAVSLVKSASASGGNISNNHTIAIIHSPSLHSKQNGSTKSNVVTMADNAIADMIEHDEKCGRPKKSVKEYSRHLSTIPESTKLSLTSDSKKPSSDFKGSSISSSSKVPLVPNVAFNRVSGECTSSQEIESSSNAQNKAAASDEPGKGEKLSQPGSHLSSRGNMASIAPTSANFPTNLSDEELALLLHQELNSSPRVPRVPRMRHAGSLPQLTGPSATSVLMKRTSSGVKDHIVASRRRTKDFSGECSHGSAEVDNEAKKIERKPTSPDNGRRDSGHSADLLSRNETDGGHAKSVQSMKKINVGCSLSSSSDANGHNVSSSHLSSRTASGDDPRMVGHLTARTLPGLIADIMREGKRMTYEELCNAVLPHWPHLRKHNGERYAYSSHFQAVLDCLRNRSEWARLVDRGSKCARLVLRLAPPEMGARIALASTSRKRSKLNADSLSIESEDNEENVVKAAKDPGSKNFESHHEDFPKGKRKARKRRRLALQGRSGIVRRRRRADVISDDESESFSISSEEESMSSEEEIQGGGESIGGSEASASSDDV
ncbi:hypothetical protein OROHE_003655 [Orobanche hederae]